MGKMTTYKGIPIRLLADFSTETQQKFPSTEENSVIYLKWWKGRTYSQDYANSARFSFRYDGEIKSFPDKQKLGEFSTTKLALEQMLKELL